MAELQISENHLLLEFSWKEQIGALRVGATIPLSDIDSIEVSEQPWSLLQGIRVGTAIPGYLLLGTMLRRGANDIVALYGKAPAIIISLRKNAAYQRLLVTVPNASIVATMLYKAVENAKRSNS